MGLRGNISKGEEGYEGDTGNLKLINILFMELSVLYFKKHNNPLYDALPPNHLGLRRIRSNWKQTMRS